MRLLLDTHTFIWLVSLPTRLRPAVRDLLHDPANVLLLSAASVWEMTIKYGKGKLDIPEPPAMFFPRLIAEFNLTPISIEHSHAVAVAGLPRIHGDPFDRLLVAQAIVEGIPIITADARLSEYPVQIIPA